MKKIFALMFFSVSMVAAVSIASVSYAETAVAVTPTEDEYYAFDFDEGLYPHYSELNGKWEIGKYKENVTRYDFNGDTCVFLPVSGIWNLQDGKYVQSQTGFSALTRSMLPNSYGDFILDFDINPLSDENTLMIYFACGNGRDGYSAEINSYQSKFILEDGEYIGTGGIAKGEHQNVKLVSENEKLSLYLNGELVSEKSGVGDLSGKIGIGSWNSAIEFTELSVEKISVLGSGKKLTGSGKQAEVVFNEITAENISFSIEAAAENIQKGKIGIMARVNERGDGYIFGIDANGAYISVRENGKEKKLKKEEFKARSGKMYRLCAMCEGENLSFYIDGQKTVSVTDSVFCEGMYGIFEKDTVIYSGGVRAYYAAKQYPPLESDGNTTYYIDSENGNDSADGKSLSSAWKSLEGISYRKFADGDVILLKGSFDGKIKLNDTNAKISISSYDKNQKAVISSCANVISVNNCENVTLSGLDIKLRHYAADKNSKLGVGRAIVLNDSDNILISDCIIEGAGENVYAYAIQTDSILTEPVLTDTEIKGFKENEVFVGEKPSETETEENSHWAYGYMNLLVKKNIISEYRPDDKITRAEFASMLVGALGLVESEYREIFKDVSADMWYAKKIQTISDYRYLPLEMTSGGTASANSILIRAELAAVAALVSECDILDGADESGEECDVWMKKYISSAVKYGLMSENEEGLFNPYGEVTRAEACVVLIKLMEEKGTI